MIVAIIVEVIGVCHTSRHEEDGEKTGSSENFPLRRACV